METQKLNKNMKFKYFYCWARVNLQGISTRMVNGSKFFQLVVTIISIFNISCLKKKKPKERMFTSVNGTKIEYSSTDNGSN